jgi:hypothetical protein
MWTTSTLLMWIGLIGSVVLVAQHRPVLFPIIALIASGFEALMSFHLVSLNVAHVPLGLVFGVALLVSGIIVVVRSAAKVAVSAATCVALVGALQTISALHFH